MCTAICLRNIGYSLFGRNLDLDYNLNESVILAPRGFAFDYIHDYMHEYIDDHSEKEHFAILGAAALLEGKPLFYDGVNEHGLCMASLNFPGNAVMHDAAAGKINIAPHEIIPYILGSCKSVSEAEALLSKINLTNRSPSHELPLGELHFIISDKSRSITAEPLADGIKIYKNTVEVLTNNPPFDFHMQNLSHYLNLSNEAPRDGVFEAMGIKEDCRGLGTLGLPGDPSSPSRFIRAAFLKTASPPSGGTQGISQAFHILSSVAFTCGEVKLGDQYDITQYTSVIDMNRLIYHFTSYQNRRICAVEMKSFDLSASSILKFPIHRSEDVEYLNRF